MKAFCHSLDKHTNTIETNCKAAGMYSNQPSVYTEVQTLNTKLKMIVTTVYREVAFVNGNQRVPKLSFTQQTNDCQIEKDVFREQDTIVSCLNE